jgi:hypothetical protein
MRDKISQKKLSHEHNDGRELAGIRYSTNLKPLGFYNSHGDIDVTCESSVTWSRQARPLAARDSER